MRRFAVENAKSGPHYSAHVEMRLFVDGQVLSIGQLGPDFIILDKPLPHPPSKAEIAVSINGHERRWKVYLPEGIHVGRVNTKVV